MRALNFHNPEIRDPHDMIRRMATSMKILEAQGAYSIEKFIVGWNRGAKSIDDIRVNNVKSFLSWAFFNMSLTQALNNDEKREMLAQCYEKLEEAFPETMSKIKVGYNEKLVHAAMCLEYNYPVLHRPLALYFVIKLIDLWSNLVFLRGFGFTKYQYSIDSRSISNQKNSYDKITYWMREHHVEKGQVAKPPMVYFHGISHGWWSYAMMIDSLSPDRTVILIDLDNIKVASLNFDAPPPQVYSDGVHGILEKHGIKKCSIVGHSFGSITATWFMRYYPKFIDHLILIDPVALIICVPDVCNNFLYRNPSTVMEWVICIFAALEVTISHTLFRNFTWHENCFWFEDVPDNVATSIVLAGKDEILNGPVLRTYCEHYNSPKENEKSSKDTSTAPRSVLYFEDYGHGQACLTSSTLNQVAELVQSADLELYKKF